MDMVCSEINGFVAHATDEDGSNSGEAWTLSKMSEFFLFIQMQIHRRIRGVQKDDAVQRLHGT